MTLPLLIDSSSSERARELLRIARADGPRPGAAQRTLAALGVVGSTATVAGAALGSAGAQAGPSAALGSAASSLPLLAAKWLVVGTLSGLVLASGATLAFSSRPGAPAPSARATTRAPAPPASAAPEAASAAPVVELAQPVVESPPAPSKPVKPASVVAKADATTAPVAAPSQAAFDAPEQSKLLHDVALLDDARRALKAGHSAQALSLIARYEAERQTHVLDREAELLRQRARDSSAK